MLKKKIIFLPPLTEFHSDSCHGHVTRPDAAQASEGTITFLSLSGWDLARPLAAPGVSAATAPGMLWVPANRPARR